MASVPIPQGNADRRLILAISLLRLRDSTRGSRGDNEVGVTFLNQLTKFTKSMVDGIDDINRLDKLRRDIREYVLETWEVSFPNDAENLNKFLSLLGELRLNISEEVKELRGIQADGERAVQTARKFLSEGISTMTKEEISKAMETDMNELLLLFSRVAALKQKVDTRVADAIAILSQTSVPLRSDELFDLFTKEP